MKQQLMRAQSTAAATTDKFPQATNGSVKDASKEGKQKRSVKDAKDLGGECHK